MKHYRALLPLLATTLLIVVASGCPDSTKQYRLSIEVFPEDGGYTNPPSGALDYDEGVEVDVTATPSSGFEFERWTLDGVEFGDFPTTTVAIDSDRTLTALFHEVVPDYTLSLAVSPAGAGETTPPEGDYSFRAGTEVFVSAAAAPGFEFLKWELDGFDFATKTAGSLTMNGDVSLTAVFQRVAPEYTLTLSSSPEIGGRTEPAAGSYTHTAGEVVAVEAIPSEGYRFLRWMVDGIDHGTNPSTEIAVESDIGMVALFETVGREFSLRIVVEPPGAGETFPAEGSRLYDEGETVALSAVPAQGYEFVAWRRDDSDFALTPSSSVIVDEDIVVTALFRATAVASYTLTVRVEPPGAGETVPAEGSGVYDEGERVALSAVAAQGYEFVAWRRNDSDFASTASSSVVIDEDIVVTALFRAAAAASYTLTVRVEPLDAGRTVPEIGAHVHDAGAVVAVAATAFDPYEFVRWTLDGVAYSTDAETTVTLNADAELVATFAAAAPEVVMTIGAEPESGGTTSPEAGSHVYAPGTTILIGAQPATGYAFAKWTIDGSEYSTDLETAFTIEEDTKVTAVFEPLEQSFTLTVETSPAGSGTTSPTAGSHSYPAGTAVTLSATAATGFRFSSWSQDGAFLSAETEVSITVESDTLVTAFFEIRSTATLTLSVFPENGGTTEPPVGEHVYDTGSVVSILAIAAPGHRFERWTRDGAEYSTDASSTLTVDANTSLIAEFALEGPVAVVFPDANLEAEIRKALDRFTGTIFKTDLESLDELRANYSSIADLRGLEYCVNLRVLHLVGNAIVDLTPLENLVSLNELYLSQNEIFDADALSDLVNLTVLGLSYNELRGIAPLANLNALQTLTVSGNMLEDVSVLSGLTNLERLALSGNPIEEISALLPLTKLSRLHLDNTRVRDIGTLVANSGIGANDYVDLRGCPLGEDALCVSIPALKDRGVDVASDGECGLAFEWRYNPDTGHYYTLSPSGAWLEAEAQALDLSANLAASNDSAENTWLLETFPENDRYWIGLFKPVQDGPWEWSSGEEASFTQWAPGEPDDTDPGKDVALIDIAGGGPWVSDRGTDSRSGIIERDRFQEVPTAAFTVDAVEGVAPMSAFFEDRSLPGAGPITEWAWDFGDPGSGTSNVDAGQFVSHIFNTPGTYIVTLTVTTAYGIDTAARVLLVTPGDGTILNDHVVLIDDNPNLFVESISGDTLVLTYTGEGSVNIQPGDILVGTAEGGYLRRVLSVSQNGQQVTVTTAPASLVEVFEEVYISHTVRLSAGDTLKGEGVPLSLDGVTLGIPDVFLAELSGVIEYAPDLEFEAQIRDNRLEYFRVAASGPLVLDLDLAASGTDAAIVSDETIVFSTQQTFEFFAGSVPIVGTIDMAFEIQVSGETNGAATLATGFDWTNEVVIGAEYELEDWRNIVEANLLLNSHATTWEEGSGLDLNLSITLRIEIAFYQTEGPSMALTTSMDLDEQADESVFQQDILVGADATIDMEVGIIDGLVAGAFWFVEGARESIHSFSEELGVAALAVDTDSFTLSLGAPSGSFGVTNAGTGTLSWTAFSNAPGVSLSPLAFVGNAAEVTIGATDFSQSYPAEITFTNDEDAGDSHIVNVAVVARGALGGAGAGESVDVPEGWLEMGQGEEESVSIHELPRHNVFLDAYSIGKYEVTNAEYAGVLNWALSNGYVENWAGESYTGLDVYTSGKLLLRIIGSSSQIAFTNGLFVVDTRDGQPMDNHPVVEVSWYGALAYCNWLSELSALPPAYNLSNWELVEVPSDGYRLPTEAEWERAAAWNTKHWTYGFQSDDIDNSRSNFDSANPLGLALEPFTTQVGHYNGINPGTLDSASPVGSYDMSGNVWEWCHDRYGVYSGDDQVNPTGSDTGLNRVVRGGSWFHDASNARTAIRPPYFPTTTNSVIGFRIGRSR